MSLLYLLILSHPSNQMYISFRLQILNDALLIYVYFIFSFIKKDNFYLFYTQIIQKLYLRLFLFYLLSFFNIFLIILFF